MRKTLLLFCCCTIIFAGAEAQKKKSKKDFLITVSTNFGDMKLLLSDKTPKHKENFIKLAEEGFYDSLLFHRVIKEFMIQGGDPDSKNSPKGKLLGNGSTGYKIPAEFHKELFHKKGVIAAARDNNPEKASSGCQFYIVQGKTLSDAELEDAEQRTGQKISDVQKEVYKTDGGTPWLDQNYTVFGEVIEGVEVVDKIAETAKDRNDRPEEDVIMTVSIKKMKKKKITKLYGYTFN